jgi:TaqI-like C-terminal specificity domain
LIMSKRPCPLAGNERPPNTETMAACEVPREHWHDRMDLRAFVSGRRHHVPTNFLRKEGWSLENPSVLNLLDRIRCTGMPLKEYVGCSPLMGLKTGLNEAFIISALTRDRLIRTTKKSEELIRPLLRGRDADRWRSRNSDAFLITIASSENTDWPWSHAGTRAEQVFQKTYPTIYGHFLPFKKALIERQDQGRYWWELRSCDYMEEFDKPKIVWQEMAWFTRFSVDMDGRVLNNTAYILPSTDPFAVAALNSPLAWWFMWRTAQHGKDEVLRLIHSYVSEFPMPEVSKSSLHSSCASLVLALADAMRSLHKFAEETELEAQRRFGPIDSDGKVVSWLALPGDAFVSRFLKLAGVRQPKPSLREEVGVFQRSRRAHQVELLTRQLDLEKTLAGFVEDAYGLTPEERALLRATRPVRDPLDVLEAKIRGGTEENDSNASQE